MRLIETVALITGAGSGIGRASGVRLAREGAKVGLLDLKEKKLDDLAAQIRGEGGEAIGIECDVSQPEEVRAAVRQVLERWGRIDVVFANAGINGVWAPIDELKPDEWDQTMNVNLKGTWLIVKYAVPALKKNGGSIIITSSVNGTRIFSNAGATAYSCSKAGQVAFCKMAAFELAPHSIRVNVICPGAIETQIGQNTEKRDTEDLGPQVEFPEGREPLGDRGRGQPEDVAELVLFLASKESRHITGTVTYIDAGHSLLQG